MDIEAIQNLRNILKRVRSGGERLHDALPICAVINRSDVGGYASGTDIVMNLKMFVFDFLYLWF